LKKLLVIAIIFLLYSNLYSIGKGGIVEGKRGDESYPGDEIIISYVMASPAERERIERTYGLVKKLECSQAGWCSYYTDGREIRDLCALLVVEPCIVRTQPNYYFHLIWTPNDPYYAYYQWHLQRIGMENAWDIEHGGDSTVIVGVLDSGVAFEDYPVPSYERHTIDSSTTSYLKLSDYGDAHFVAGFDFINNDAHPNDNHSHGSHVASTIVESTDNSLFLAGISFGVTVMPVKVVDWIGLGNADEFAMGVYYAVDNGAHILNMSLAASANPGPVVEDAIAYAAQHDVIMVAGAGNTGSGNVCYPAKYDEVIAVSATVSSTPDSLAYYSNFGSGVEIAAPGGDLVDRDNNGFPDLVVQQTILPGIYNNGFAKPDSFVMIGYGGTSMATPHVTGTVALMRSAGIPYEHIRPVLHQTALDCGQPGYDTLFGYGRIDAFLALGGGDTIPPEITETTILEDTYFPGPYAVWATITDLFGVSQSRIWYRVNSQSWEDSLCADQVHPDRFLFYIPEVTPPAVVKYYIEAADLNGNTATDPDGAPNYYYSFIAEETGIEQSAEGSGNTAAIPTFLSGDMLELAGFSPPCGMVTVSLYDVAGRRVATYYEQPRRNGKISLATGGLSNGIYFLRLQANGELSSHRLLKIY
jgi:serine protease